MNEREDIPWQYYGVLAAKKVKDKEAGELNYRITKQKKESWSKGEGEKGEEGVVWL